MFRFNKLFVSLVTLIVLLVMSVAVVFAEGTDKGTITGDKVNVRAKPDISSKILIQLSKGAVVYVTSSEGDWYKISANEIAGWVSSKYVKITDKIIGKGTIKGNNVNIRSKPEVSSDKVAKLNNGTNVDVIRKAGNWYRISINDKLYGWVNSSYLIYRESVASRGTTDETPRPVSSDKPEASKNDTGKNSDIEDQSAKKEDNDIRQQIVAYAKKYLGVKYVYGGSSPKGFDCSGFVQYVFKNFDIDLDRSSEDQALNGTKISKSELKPGDTVFFDTNGGKNAIEHAGIYIGDGKFIHASSGSSNRKVVISEINEGFYNKCYMWARRVIKD